MLLLMTIQPEAWSSTEARFAKPIAEERMVISTKETVVQKEKGVRKERNQERGQGGNGIGTRTERKPIKVVVIVVIRPKRILSNFLGFC